MRDEPEAFEARGTEIMPRGYESSEAIYIAVYAAGMVKAPYYQNEARKKARQAVCDLEIDFGYHPSKRTIFPKD